ncbi:MAG: hypothetical protein NTW14_12790 [bacterium]|nr:hypothetical protein [bacterium]
MAGHTPKGSDGQFEIGLFGDLSQFDELERKVAHLIQRFGEMQAENAEMKLKLNELENDLQKQNSEIDLSINQRDLLIRNQRDSDRDELIKSKIMDLIAKLDKY